MADVRFKFNMVEIGMSGNYSYSVGKTSIVGQMILCDVINLHRRIEYISDSIIARR